MPAKGILPAFGLMALFVAAYTLYIMHRISWQVMPASESGHRKMGSEPHFPGGADDTRDDGYASFQAQQQQTRQAAAPQLPLPPFDEDANDSVRATAVRDALRYAWGQYEQYAFGFDELQPASQKGQDNFGGLGATIVDSLDTLWLLGMREEFARAQQWVAESLTFDKPMRVSLFETNIRVVGGLLAAHEVSGEAVFLDKARDLLDRVSQAFNCTTGIPYNFVRLPRLKTTRSVASGTAALAELGTFALEFEVMSRRTGQPEYGAMARRIYETLNKANPGAGLLSIRVNRRTGKAFTTRVHLTVGAMADSYYEYLLKAWLLSGQQDDMYQDMWVRAMDDMVERLLTTTDSGELTYVAEVKHKPTPALRTATGLRSAPASLMTVPRMEELSCYLPGNLALGIMTGAVQGERAARYREVAANLTYTCWQMYERSPTGLAPEDVWLNGTLPATSKRGGAAAAGGAGEMVAHGTFNMLRPETIESLWYMWRLTGERRYQRWGWAIFGAIERHCKLPGGYTGIKDVTVVPPEPDDQMQSFFLAETLKYLWLLFSPPDTIDLGEWVLNTEAHLLRIRTRPAPAQF